MNTQTIARLLTGILVLLLGVGALLDAVNVIPFWEQLGNYWPLIFVTVGLVIFLSNPRQYISALAFIAAGSVLQLNELGVISINVWDVFWPIILIAVGISIIMNRVASPKQVKTQDSDAISAIFAGNETISTSKDYQGGKATAILGGIVIDLRDATIKKEATLEVFSLLGGIEIKVPREWNVQHSVFPILGGVESKSHSDKTKDSAPTLIITGTAVLGGIEIHS